MMIHKSMDEHWCIARHSKGEHLRCIKWHGPATRSVCRLVVLFREASGIVVSPVYSIRSPCLDIGLRQCS